VDARIGLHSGQQYATFGECLDLWLRAEGLGYDWVSVFDHYRPPLGGRDGPCLEGPTLLAALAARTARVRCGMLVLGVHRRHPATVAAIAATLDHISDGRLELGLGAGGPDLADTQWGLPCPPAAERVALLDETCAVLRSLWERDRTSHSGPYVRLEEATLRPKPVQRRLPLVIGGAGPRLLQVVARHADVWNALPGSVDRYRRSVGRLSAACTEARRDPATVRRSITFRAVLGETPAEAAARRDETFGRLPTGSPDRAEYLSVGTPEQCVADLMPYAELGVRDFLLGVRPPVDWRTVELMATAVGPALRAALR
jgi:alkanesulfonate monooxygenase SsuD/methylene tetrahydromethanopterin reductase-like flavin-dependent oxidoreductase (luciferase family)